MKRETRTCPFPDCDWSTEITVSDDGTVWDDGPIYRHYERQHAGRVRVLVTVEFDVLLGGRSPRDVRETMMERVEEDGYTVAYASSEVLTEADDHEVVLDAG